MRLTREAPTQRHPAWGRPGFGPVITPTVTPVLTRYVPMRPLTNIGRTLVAAALALFSALLLVLWSPDALADDIEARRAESPYFHIKDGDPNVDQLPLKSTRVDVRIAGVIADVTVTQHYRNEGTRPIEAKYVFPAATGAAVHAMNVRIGDRLLTAQIREKQRARIEYETAKREGKTGALLEQERPNVFQMNVANILPGDQLAVELRYTELIAPNQGRYQFMFPTVVGPRYHSPQATAKFPPMPFLKADEPSKTAFDMHVLFASPLPVSELRSPSHGIEISNDGRTDAKIELADEAEARNNRDFILDYRLAGERTATGLTLYKGTTENFFLALVEPPKAIPVEQINPREYIFVVDISGSMHGYPLQTSKALLRNLIGNLRPSDTFNVLLFSGSAEMLNPTPVPASRANIERAIHTIDQQRGGGSTEIVPALKRIAALPKNKDVSRSVIVVTDGYVTVEQEVFALVRKNLGNSNVFAFGIGHSVNRHLIEGIARAGQGEAFVVTKPEHAATQAERLRKMIDSPVLTHVKARFEGLDVYDLEPSAALPDVLGGRPVVIFGKWRGDPVGQLVLEGHAANGTHQDVVPVGNPDSQAVALQHLWARHRIAQLSDQEALDGGTTKREAILALGLQYNLLTQYTSFLAVDKVVRTTEAATPVNQPSPMPKEVSNLAIGTQVPSTPEPGTWLAMLLVGGLMWGVMRRRAEAVPQTAGAADTTGPA